MKTKPSQVGRNGSRKAASTQSKSRASAARFNAKEFKLVSLRECSFRDGNPLVETPKDAADYWRKHISTEARFNPHAESLVLLMLNTRRRLIGHVVLSQGTKNTLLINNGDVLRTAVIAGADAVVLMHNHPSGDPCPSDKDIKATHEFRRAGALLKIEVCDHVIMGKPSVESARDFASLREIGYFAPLPDVETAVEKTKATEEPTAPPQTKSLFGMYQGFKSELPNALLFFQVGDFAEIYFEDAERVASLLKVSLTKRGDAPMCGVPIHAFGAYMSILFRNGFTIVLYECDPEAKIMTSPCRMPALVTVRPAAAPATPESKLLASLTDGLGMLYRLLAAHVAPHTSNALGSGGNAEVEA